MSYPYYGAPQNSFYPAAVVPQQPQQYMHDAYAQVPSAAFSLPNPPQPFYDSRPQYQQFPPAMSAYPQPLPPQQQPQPDLNNPNIFRPFFRSGLESLTVNSKVIIQDLTAMANQFSLRMAGIIAEELEEHIRICPPFMKLPALYLMDSIAKNLGAPYPVLFSRYLERLFLQAYRDVDQPARIKMEELLGTWRTGGPNGSPLYPMQEGRIQRTLEEALFGRGGRGGGIGANGGGMFDSTHFVAGVQQRAATASVLDTLAITAEIRKVLGMRRAQMYRDPNDQSNQISIEALEKLEHLVTTSGVTMDQIAQIRQQLTGLTPPEPEAPQQLESNLLSSLSNLDSATLSSLLAAQSQAPIASTSSNDPSSLLESLLQSGIVGDGLNGTLQRVAASSKDDREQVAQELEYRKKLFDSYDEQNRAIGLTSSEINKPKARAHLLLYDELPLQCTQCAARWLETPRHKKIFAKHMDRHFRTNNRLSSATRAQSRSWFITADEWLKPPMEIVEKSEEETKREDLAEIMKSRVVQPIDPAKQSKPCPICKENFKAEWSDVDEEWFWTDAKKVDGTIYHASCYAEMTKLRGPARSLAESEHDSSSVPASPPQASREASAPPASAEDSALFKIDPDLLQSVADLVRSGTPVQTLANGQASPLPPSGLKHGKRAASQELESDSSGGDEARIKRVKQEADL